MAWIRLDDQIPRHAKMVAAGPAACWLWVCAIAHCQSQLTDGFVSNDAMKVLGVVTQVSPEGSAKRHKSTLTVLISRLVSVHLLDRIEGGYAVHDYLDYNQSKSEVLKKRREDLDRKRIPHGIRPESAQILHGIRADSKKIPSDPSRARASVSDPIPSDPKEELKTTPDVISSVVASPIGGNGNSGTTASDPLQSAKAKYAKLHGGRRRAHGRL